MAVWDKKVLWSFMLFLAGAVGQSVNHSGPVCAVKGSAVTLPCTFTPLKSFIQDGREILLQIKRVIWCKNHLICHGSTPSVYDSDLAYHNPRYHYLGDKEGNCTLHISDLQNEDDATFRFRMEATYTEGHFTEQSGVKVTVQKTPQMRIISSTNEDVMREGETVTLTCSSRCTFHQLEVTWFRDDHALKESAPTLMLSPLTAGDSGNYTCGLKMNARARSLPYTLHVERGEEGDTNGPLIIGVVLGVLLALCALILVIFVIKRKQSAADKDQRPVGCEVEQKFPNDIYSNTLPCGEQTGENQQETREVEEDVSYAPVQFRCKNQARQVNTTEDAVIYSSLVIRG